MAGYPACRGILRRSAREEVMGIFGKLFGGKKEEKRPAAQRSGRRPPPDVPAGGGPQSTDDLLPDMDQMTAKQLARKLGSGNPNIRYAIEERLGQMKEHSAMRPLMNAYLMNGDQPALAALDGYGPGLARALQDLANDLTNTGERRARIMDMLALTGDENALPIVRESVDDNDPLVRARACAALVALGDLNGVARLDQDLQSNDVDAKRLALETLMEMDLPEARACTDEHINRYIAESDAVPVQAKVVAPLLDNPKLKLHDVIVEAVASADHDLTLVVGGEAINYATARRTLFEEGIPNAKVFFGTRRMVPEEQIAEVEAARDLASHGERAVFVGMAPSPADDPPMPHFLKAVEGGKDFHARLIVVDPHEFGAAQSWWYHVLDMADVPTDIDIYLGVSTPGRSAISEEEFDIYQLLKTDELKTQFKRALLARM
jgi:hypothetical protein